MKTRTRNALIVVLALVLVAAMTVSVSFADTDSDVTIGSLSELQALAAAVNGGDTYEGKTVKLTADIDLGGSDSPWTPIGASGSFKGTFDGDGHVISGLYIASGSKVGLFGTVDSGIVKNVIVRGEVTGASNVAGIVGYLNVGQIINCGNEVNVSGGANVGGVVGSVNGASTISGCYNKGSVTGTTGYIGGVTGQHWRAGTVINCYNAGTVTGPACVGGVTGGHSAASTILENCYNVGTVVDSAGNNNSVCAVVGRTKADLTNCYYVECGVGDTKTGVTKVEDTESSVVKVLKAALLGDAFVEDEDGLNNGYPILTWQQRVPDEIISTVEQFKAFADRVNGGETFEDKLIRLDVNLDLACSESNAWTPIGASGSFKGTFDGSGHVISGLYIGSGSTIGLFGTVNGGTIKNLVVRGEVIGSGTVGGIVGSITAGQIINSGNEANVKGGANIGGVVGSVNGESTISGCYNKGSVTGTIGYIGGVTGQHWRAGTVINCYNAGTVTGPACVGGVTGGHSAASPVLENCYNVGKVVDSTGNKNSICAVVGRTKADLTNCYYLECGADDTKTGVTKISDEEGSTITVLKAALLGDAFEDVDSAVALKWESSVCTDDPVRPAFVEKTALSKQLASYIKDAVKSAKAQKGITGTLLGDEGFTSGASSTATDWMALAMGSFGYWDNGTYVNLIDDGTGYEDYLAAMKAYIEATYAANDGILHSVKATEWQRAIVAIAALGGDPTNFGTYNGKPINLVADGTYNCVVKNGPGTQGINGWIWGLIALDTGSYQVPADAKYPRETFIKEILKMQLTDGVNGNKYGGWVLGGYGSSSDIDITAMAIQALAPYYNDDTVYTYVNEQSKETVSKTVRQCVDEALDVLGTKQNSKGGFASWGTDNVESVAQVVVALCSVGIDPAKDSRFVTSDGKTVLDGMLQFKLSDGGFCHTAGTGWNSMANDQATYALVSYWRFENGLRSLYDARQAMTSEAQTAVNAATEAIAAANDPTATNYKAQLKEALNLFRQVPAAERRYVRNYSALAAAIELVGGEAALDTDAPYAISISVTKNPDKTRYYADESFDPTGMEITVKYSDGSTKVVTDYSISASEFFVTEEFEIYVYYGILQTTVIVEVRERMPWSGEGTEDDPYLIETPDDLVDLRWYLLEKKIKSGGAGTHFKMTQDINLKNIADWKSIAQNDRAGFRGHFDGNGFAIWNLNSRVDNVSGLFGILGDGALIENLTIASGEIGNTSYSVRGGAIAAGIGEDASATIKNCHNYATVIGNWSVGGILGEVTENSTLTVENCSNHGEIRASYTGGGIVGQVGPNRWKGCESKATIINCYNAGKITGAGNWGIGGIVGSYRLGGAGQVIRNCYNVGIVSGTKEASVIGAIFGSIAEADLTLENTYYLEGSCSQANGLFDDDGEDTVGTVTGTATVKSSTEMISKELLESLGSAFEADSNEINSGYPVIKGQKGIGKEPAVRARTEIHTADELAAFAELVNNGESFTNKTVLLMADIDLSKFASWTSIGNYSSRQFDGIFDGQGHVIKNLTTNYGLFRYAGTNAVIKNLGIVSGTIGKDNLSFVGAIVGWSNGADIINCWNGASVSGSYAGGIVGTVRDGGESIIQGCYNVGSVTGAFQGNVGGIVGHLATTSQGTNVNVTVSDCYNLGAITAADDCGGIVGRAQDGHVIKNCYNAGVVTANGENILDGAGAIASYVTSKNTITNCYYDSSLTNVGVAHGDYTVTGKTPEEMKSAEFVSLLGDYFKQDRYGLVNGGYALLDWQATEDADAVDEVVEKINAIGTVTVDSGEAIASARALYQTLSSELKALVSNLSVLEQAESDYQAALFAQKKAQAKQELEAYKNAEDYRKAEQDELAKIVADGKLAIDEAQTEEALAAALSQAKAKADLLKTNAQLTTEEVTAFQAAVANLEGKKNQELFDALKATIELYGNLSDGAKELAKEDCFKLQAAIAFYNESVATQNAGFQAANETALYMFAASLSFLAAIVCLLKRKFL